MKTRKQRLGLGAARVAAFHRLFPRWALARAVGRTAEREVELRLLPVLCDPSRCAIDVGANIGLYTHALMTVARRVIAIEPHPRLAHILRSLPAERVEVIEAIVAAEGGAQQTLAVDVVDGREADALGRVAEGVLETGARHFRRGTVALDDFAGEAIGFVKVDVEGYELEVLRGARRLIEAQRPVFLVEAEARHRPSAPHDVFAYFRERGYASFFVKDRAVRQAEEFDPADQDLTLLTGYGSREQCAYVNNFMFLPEESDCRAVADACNAILQSSGGK